MKARMTMLCALLLGVAAFAAGCGGDDDDGDLTTASVGKAAWVKKVNALCEKSTDGMLASMIRYGKENAGQPPEEVATGAVQSTVPAALQSQIEEIRALGAPAGDEAKVEAYLASVERGIEAVEASKPTDIFALQETLDLVNRPAAAYGLEKCEY